MDDPRVYIVLLRRPRSARQNPGESRADPYYERGSFGCTRCHDKNLMKPDEKAEMLSGGRLAFAQGGDGGFRVVLLTPPVTICRWKDRCEALWTPAEMPFRYTDAPILVCNDGRSDFPGLQRLAARTLRGKTNPKAASPVCFGAAAGRSTRTWLRKWSGCTTICASRLPLRPFRRSIQIRCPTAAFAEPSPA